MCIVIDSCVLPKVFKESDKQHSNYRPVCDWIVNGQGALVYGGTKFEKEIFEHHKWFLKFLGLLQSQKKAIRADTAKVDRRQAVVERLVKDPDFDDPHLLALLGVTGCQLICTGDVRAEKFILDKKLYPKGAEVPSIFKDAKKHVKLLSSEYIGKCCTPCVKLNKENRKKIGLPIPSGN